MGDPPQPRNALIQAAGKPEPLNFIAPQSLKNGLIGKKCGRATH